MPNTTTVSAGAASWLKGWRTVLVQILFTSGMVGGIQTSDLPPLAQHLLTLGATAWGLIGLVMRMVTTTPIGQSIEAMVEKDTGITQAQYDALVAKLPQGSITDIPARVSALEAAVTAAFPKPQPPSQTFQAPIAAPAMTPVEPTTQG